MKILFLGDYSNLHACLAKELRRRGHNVTVFSDRGGYLDTQCDIYAERRPGLLGAFSYLYRLFEVLPQLKGYDVVQLINPGFLKLRPGKTQYFFDRIASQNDSMRLTLAGDDYYFVKACAGGELFRYSEFLVDDKPTEYVTSNPVVRDGWLNEPNRRLHEHIYSRIDGAVSVLPEYDMAARPILGDRLKFINLPVDLAALPWRPLTTDGPLRIFIGIRGGMEIQKGTARLFEIAKEVEREMPGLVRVETVRNLSLKDYLSRMAQSHVVLDQRYSYSPATNALQAMALGKIAGSGAQPEYYRYIGNPEVKPVFSLSPLQSDGEIADKLRHWAQNREEAAAVGRESRLLVERHNDVRIVAERYLETLK